MYSGRSIEMRVDLHKAGEDLLKNNLKLYTRAKIISSVLRIRRMYLCTRYSITEIHIPKLN